MLTLKNIEKFKTRLEADVITNDEEEIKRKEKTIKAYGDRLTAFSVFLKKNKIKIDKNNKATVLKQFMKAGYTKNNKHKVYSKSTIKLLEVALNKFYLLEGKPNPFSFNEIEKRTQKEFLKQNGSKTTEHIKYKTLSKNEYERILNYISNGNHRVRNRQKLRNAVLLMLAFGLRVSELTRLEKSDFTLNGKVKLHVKPSKRGKARDTYYIFGDKYKDEILSIIENEEFDFNIHTVSKQIERIKEVLGISQLSTHSFRHTFATTYLTKGGSLESLAKLLGHSDTKTTQIYGKIINQRIEQELDYLTPAEIEE